MKKKILLMASGIFGHVMVGQAALVAHYKFDETTGTTALDSSGNGYHATINGGVSFVVDSAAGGAYSFNGTSGFVTASKNGSPNSGFFSSTISSGQLTLSAWVKTPVTTDNRNVVVYAGSGSASQTYVDLGYSGTGSGAINNGGAGSAYARSRPGNLSSGDGVTGVWSQDPVNDDEWNHLVMTLNVGDTSSLLILYVNGALEHSVTLTGTSHGLPTLNTFSVGRLDRGTPVDYFGGLIDDVQVYSTALTGSQVAWLSANPGQAIPEPGTCGLAGLGLLMWRRRRRA